MLWQVEVWTWFAKNVKVFLDMREEKNKENESRKKSAALVGME